MRKILVTGGTVFVSRFVANYFAQKGDDVYVLNRNSKPQLPNVTLIEGDRNDLGDKLKGHEFDAVLDITAYTREHVENLVNALGRFGDYIMISSSAVYPETNPQPFTEDQICGPNIHWGNYGTNKLAAEEYLHQAVPRAYILRPPYLYGPMENVYRAPFVFACAEAGRKFYIPGDGSMKLQFFHVEDLCRFMEILLEIHPAERVYNVGNPEAVTVAQWVRFCYDAVGADLETVSVTGHPRAASHRELYAPNRIFFPNTTQNSHGRRQPCRGYFSCLGQKSLDLECFAVLNRRFFFTAGHSACRNTLCIPKAMGAACGGKDSFKTV